MKLNKFLVITATLLFFIVNFSFAQEKEMTKEEWQNEMNRLQTQKQSLTNEVSTLKTEVDNLNNNLNSLQSYEDCMDELYTMVNANKSQVDQYRQAVNELQGKISRKEGPKEDRQKDLDALKQNKISALPEFYEKVHNQLQSSLDSWVEEPTEVLYTVVRGDCLWNIAKKQEFYGNGFAWPKIYQANRDQIKNPDLIYPQQEFKIPPLTAEEKDKYDTLRRNYKPAPVQ
jgi:peptidoglycan hydrolase CwlO-like protein